jgi:hypothetical protein
MAGVETTNGATVVMRDNSIEGSTPPFSTVYMFDTGYIPYIDRGLGIVLASDEDGKFQLNGIGQKTLNVQVVDNVNNISALVPVDRQGLEYKSGLKRSGTLQGTIECTRSGRILVFVSGTGYYILLDKQGAFTIKSLSPGSYTVQAALLAPSLNGAAPAPVAFSEKITVVINSDKTTVLNEKIIVSGTSYISN